MRTKLGSGAIPRAGVGDLPQCAHLKIQHRQLRLIIVARAGLLNFRLGFVELRLAELDDRTQPQVIARIREFQRPRRLIEQLIRHREPLKGGIRVEPGSAHISDYPVLQIVQVLLLRLGPRGGLGVPR